MLTQQVNVSKFRTQFSRLALPPATENRTHNGKTQRKGNSRLRAPLRLLARWKRACGFGISVFLGLRWSQSLGHHGVSAKVDPDARLRVHRLSVVGPKGEEAPAGPIDLPMLSPGRSFRKRCSNEMSDQFFYLQLKFTPKIGHTFTDEREVVVEVPRDLVQRKSESMNESLREVIALELAKSAALGTFRPSRNGLSIFMMRLRQFGIATGIQS
jgi:hypothetical protein